MRMTSRSVRPMAQETGFPPNVDENSRQASEMEGVVITAANGCPLPAKKTRYGDPFYIYMYADKDEMIWAVDAFHFWLGVY